MKLKSADLFISAFQKIYHSGEKTLLAFSGGADSTALFYLLLAYREQYPEFDFEVFHLNHRLRGAEGDGDEEFVRELCLRFGLTCHLERKEVGNWARRKKLSVEEAGRAIRYRHLFGLLEKRRLDSVTTAHHRDDRLETFFLQLFQGAGPGALSGMNPRENRKVRPLLEFSKKEILEFLQENRLPWRQDSTNLKNNHLRNRLRLDLLPLFEKEFPQYSEKILQFQTILSRQKNFIQKFLIPWETLLDQRFLARERFMEIDEAIRPEQLLAGLKSLNPKYYLRTSQLERLTQEVVVWNGTGHKIFLETKNYLFLGTAGYLFFVDRSFFLPFPLPEYLGPGDHLDFSGGKLFNREKETVFLNFPKPGQRVFFGCHKKCKDFLIDRKVFYHWRCHVRILEDSRGEFLGLLEPVGGRCFLNHRGREFFELNPEHKR